MFNVVLNNNTIEQYDKLLSRFSNWTTYKRDIKLNTILEQGKKIEFKVDIENHQFGGLYISIENDIYDFDINLKNVCAVTKSMIFIINDSKVESLKIELKILETDKGKIISNIIKDFELELYQKITENDIIGFYFRTYNRAA